MGERTIKMTFECETGREIIEKINYMKNGRKVREGDITEHEGESGMRCRS